MPTTTVVKTIGAISIFTSLMKPSPSGLMAAAFSGETTPNTTPIAIATSTWKYRLEVERPFGMRAMIAWYDRERCERVCCREPLSASRAAPR